MQWHLGDSMTHSYYLDTVENIRPLGKCIFDMCMIILIISLVMSSLAALRAKNYIGNFHETWVVEDPVDDFNHTD